MYGIPAVGLEHIMSWQEASAPARGHAIPVAHWQWSEWTQPCRLPPICM